MSTLSSSISEDGGTLEIEVGARFDFNLHLLFRAAQKSAPLAQRFVIDLSQTEYMDSSALGMLLVLHEAACHAGGNVTVRNCRPLVRQILHIANFQKLFAIE
jgi:anti-anti-sigma factor